MKVTAYLSHIFSGPICRTTNGEKCIFPSIVNGTWYRDYIHDPEIGNWCSTLNDEFENNVDGHWGICGDHCPPMLGNEVNSDLECKTVDGEDCIFPSIIDGITFHKCVPDPYEGDWCSTLNDENGHHIDGYFGNCEESCKNLNSDDGCQIIEWVVSNTSVINLTFFTLFYTMFIQVHF